MATRSYTNWRKHKIIKGEFEMEVREMLYDLVEDGYQIIQFPQLSIFSNKYVAKAKMPKLESKPMGQLEQRMSRKDEWRGMHL